MTAALGYTFKSKPAQDRIARMLKVIEDAAGRPVGSKEVAVGAKTHQTTCCTYLAHMHQEMGVIQPGPKQKSGNGCYWILGRDPKLSFGAETQGNPIVRQVKASDVEAKFTVDPMVAMLFGRRAA